MNSITSTDAVMKLPNRIVFSEIIVAYGITWGFGREVTNKQSMGVIIALHSRLNLQSLSIPLSRRRK